MLRVTTTLGMTMLLATLLSAWPAPTDADEPSPQPNIVRLDPLFGGLSPDSVQQDWGALQIDKSVVGKPLRIGKRDFAHGLGTHANSKIGFKLDGQYDTFQAWVGVDAEMDSSGKSSVVFQVFVDGREVFNSDVMRNDTPAKRVDVAVNSATNLKLVVTDAGDNNQGDHADWADAMLLSAAGKSAESVEPAKFDVVSPSLAIRLTESGRIVGVVPGKGNAERAILGQTKLAGCRAEGCVTSTKLAGGGMEFSRQLVSANPPRQCTLVERFLPTKDSIRWEVEIRSRGEPWSTAIITQLNYPVNSKTRFWTAWADPENKDDGWRDPLVLRPWATVSWSLSNLTYFLPTRGDFTAIPIATVAEPEEDLGLSLALSPEDTLLDVWMKTSQAGCIQFSRTKNRLGGERPVRFAMDLTAHEADWRGGLRWMTARYPQFFDPPNPQVSQMAGCGAYSGSEDLIDVAKFKQMAFRINWKMSDDFPYMGMFLPPLENPDDRWQRSCAEPCPPNKPQTTSFRQMNDYAQWMRKQGFYVLNYFNVTEFGKNMADVAVSPQHTASPDLWKDPRAFVKAMLSNAVLRHGQERNVVGSNCYGAWILDIGDPAYRRLMLEQADRHNKMLPDTAGICIDRLDWLMRYNLNADDGVSWVDGRPARSLITSWKQFAPELGRIMHGAGKVILVNPMTTRLDLMQEVDGFYSEQGEAGAAINTCALIGMHKPVLAWTGGLSPAPDAFFQRHLHLGAYPTAPYPSNNHCIGPDPQIDQQYLDYGPLLDAMRGKRWVLLPHCVEVKENAAKANIFEVPGGYTIPVTFASPTARVELLVRGLPGLSADVRADALHPGVEKPIVLTATLDGPLLRLRVPLHRGCAMVRLIMPGNREN